MDKETIEIEEAPAVVVVVEETPPAEAVAEIVETPHEPEHHGEYAWHAEFKSLTTQLELLNVRLETQTSALTELISRTREVQETSESAETLAAEAALTSAVTLEVVAEAASPSLPVAEEVVVETPTEAPVEEVPVVEKVEEPLPETRKKRLRLV